MRIHHVGLLVGHIESYLEQSFWTLRSGIVYDPIQKARLCLVSIPGDEGHLVELIEPAGADSPVSRAFQKGQRQHHICFEVPDQQAGEAFIRKHRLLPVTNWQPARLFDGRLVRFVYTQERELVEFVVNGHS